MGDWNVRCSGCVNEECCSLWHDVFNGHLVFTAGKGKKECKAPCQCFVIIQETDHAKTPSKVFDETLYPATAGADSLTIKDYEDTFRGGKYRLIAACIKLTEDGDPVTVPIDEKGKPISAASKENQPLKFMVARPQDVIRDGASNRILVVLDGSPPKGK